MEPERPIEKLLRAFAKKRREQAGDPPGFDLHPATRRMLQSEVARRAPRREGNFFLKLFAPVRPRLAFALGVAAVVVVGALLLLPALNNSKSRQQMASVKLDNDREAKQLADQPANSTAATPQTVAAPTTTVASDKDSDQLKKLAMSANEETKNQPDSAATRVRRSAAEDTGGLAGRNPSRSETQTQPASRGGAAGGFGGSSTVTVARNGDRSDPAYKNEINSRGVTLDESAARLGNYSLTVTNSATNYFLAAREPAARSSQSVSQTETPVRSPTLSLAGGGGMGGGGGGGAAAPSSGARSYTFSDEFRNGSAAPLNRQKFVQLSDDSKRVASLSNAVPVLTNFAVEQSGGQLRVVDSDGSVYDGYLNWVREPTATVAAKSFEVDSLVAKDAAGKEKASATFQNYFRVAGTNRSLKQNVVFTGSFLNLTNSATLMPPTGASSLGVSQSGVAPASLQQVPLQNSVIDGTIQVNETRFFRIQATPTSQK